MPLTSGTFSGRVWRVLDSLPPNFKEQFERNLQRHAFKPIDVEQGELQSVGWVNIRQMLDNRLKLEKVLFGNLVMQAVLVALRIDKIEIDQRLFRATFFQEMKRILREKGRAQLSKEERIVLEDKVRLDLIKRTPPRSAIHELAWNLETGVVFFGTTSERVNMQFSDLFTETFQVVIEPQFPFLRARRWAERAGLSAELLDVLPAPFSPEAPVDVVEIDAEGEEDDLRGIDMGAQLRRPSRGTGRKDDTTISIQVGNGPRGPEIPFEEFKRRAAIITAHPERFVKGAGTK